MNEKKYKEYDRGHRFDRGALIAYGNGELPYSYWSKKVVLKKLFEVIDKSEYTLAPIYKKHGIRAGELKQRIFNLHKDILKAAVLRNAGTHKTGNYFQNTTFYRMLYTSELPDFIEKTVYKPEEYIQLNIPVLY